MKRIFVVISNVLVCCFFIWVFTIISATVVSRYYPFVAVRGNASGIQYKKVAEKLTKLANETNSLIAIQHYEAGSNGDSVVSYNRFGKGKLPRGLVEKADSKQARGVESNYFIFRGKLTIERLKEELNQLGLTHLSVVKPFLLGSLAAIFGSGFQLLSLFIFLLCFAALSVISQIRALRTAGIRLISGEHRWKIFTDPIKEDFLSCLLGIFPALLGAVLATFVFSFPFAALYLMVVGIFVYNLLLLGISFNFCALFAIGIKKVHLMQVIKGQIPVRGIISLILIGQLVAVIIVSLGINRAFIYSKAWQQQEKGRQAWAQESRLVQLTRSRDGLNIKRSEKIDPKEWRWFQFVKEAVAKHDALLSKHNLVQQVFKQPTERHSDWQDYSPQGNVLFVTPNYLQKQGIKLDSAIREKINNLQQGEFALLLPESLKAEQKKYTVLYEKDVSMIASRQGEEQQKMKAIVSYLPVNQMRFVYNTTPIAYQQYLKDPIIVVLTPQSTGEQSYEFWSNALQNDLLLNGVKETQELLQKYQISHWASELTPARLVYRRIVEKLQIEIWTTIAGAVLGIVTSILFFNTMNLLYFEEFRRDIFIKQVSGFTFWELHHSYLLAQLLVFFLGLLASLFLTQSIWLSFIVFLLFTGNSVVLLQLQMKKESKMSVMILKGA